MAGSDGCGFTSSRPLNHWPLRRSLRWLTAFVLLAALAACGGGGGGNESGVLSAGGGGTSEQEVAPASQPGVQLPIVLPERQIASGSIMPLLGGGYVVFRQPIANVWVLQRHGADGQPVGPETTIAPPFGGIEPVVPTVAPLAGGGYALMWLQRGADGVYDVYTKSYTSAGTVMGSPLRIARTEPGRASRPPAVPQLTALAGGGYAIVWGLQPGDSGVYAQRFNADGSPAAAAHQVAAEGNGYLGVTGLTTGGYLVTWGVFTGPDGRARTYSSSDVPLGPAQPAGSNWTGGHITPPDELAALAGGGAVIAWQVAFEHLRALPLAPDATPLGSPRNVDEIAGSPPFNIWSSVVGLSDGGYVVAWFEIGTTARDGLFARRFAADGTPKGPETRVNLITTSPHSPVVVAMADGGFMITWSGVGVDGVRANYGRVFPASGLIE
jgi:hypothetical protein